MTTVNIWNYSVSAKKFSAAAILALAPTSAGAVDFTAGIVATRMAEADRYPFVAGIVEGLAYARYMRDNKTADGMDCIYRWFYDGDNRLKEILDTFERFPNHTPAAVMTAMTEKECGT